MARSFRRSVAALNREANTVCAMVDGGTLCLYAGRQPASPDISIDRSHTLLVELPFAAKAFQPADAGVADSFPLETGIAQSEGTATWFRAVQPSGAPAFDGSIGEEGDDGEADIVLDSAEIRKGARVAIESVRYVAHRG